MGAGIDHEVGREIVRKVNVRARIAKGKLQHFHSRNAEPVAQSMNLSGDHAEVLGDKRQITQAVAQDPKEVVLGALSPDAVDCGRLGCRDLPVALKAAKVVKAQDVTGADRPRYALHPPLVVLSLARCPAVK